MDELGRLTDSEMAAVLRRATEIDRRSGAGGGTWDLARIEEAAVEVGISSDAIRRAAAEVQLTGRDALVDVDVPALVPVEVVTVARVVPADPAAVAAGLVTWFEARGLQQVRERPQASLWRTREMSRSERKALPASLLRDAVQTAVVVAPAAGGPGSIVRVRVELEAGRLRAAAKQVTEDSVFGAGAAGVAGGLFLFGGGLIIGVATGAAVFALSGTRTFVRTSAGRRRLRSGVMVEVEGLLDRVELGRPLG